MNHGDVAGHLQCQQALHRLKDHDNMYRSYMTDHATCYCARACRHNHAAQGWSEPCCAAAKKDSLTTNNTTKVAIQVRAMMKNAAE